jgi:hypothetical protein
MKVEAAGPNKYALNFSGDNVETIVADGTDQPGLFGTTFSITVEAPDTWKVVRKNGGRMTIQGIWKLSHDGNTLTDDFTSYRPDGSTFHLLYTYKRTAGNSGFPGTWESVNEQVNSSYELEIQAWQQDGLSFINRAAEMTKSMNFDGKDYPAAGPNVPSGYASSAQRASDRSLTITDKIGNKVLDTQQIEVSPDGKTMTITLSIPGRTKPNIQVFSRE